MNSVKIEGRLIEEINLENGLTAQFYDQSRPVVGDRWVARLLVCIPLRIEEAYLESSDRLATSYSDFSTAMGGEIDFRCEKVRNFIDRDDVSYILDEMKKEFLNANLPYISRPQFPRRYTLKQFRAWEEEQSRRKLHMEAIDRADRVS